MFLAFQKTITGFERRLHLGKLGRMWVMTIDAVVFRTGTSSQIPISSHSTMGTMFEVPHLGAMTLRTQCHHFSEFDPATIRQLQSVVIV